jgi:preprotein translocase subunit YajC
MLRERIVWIVALVLVAGAGFYTGRMLGITTGEQNRAQAAQQFFGQRGAQGGQNGQGGQGGQGGIRRGQGGGVAGTVSDVSGNTVTVTTRNGQSMKVQLADNAAVRKQVDGQLSDIKAGEQIVAFGSQSGDVFQATSIQIGAGQGGPRASSP